MYELEYMNPSSSELSQLFTKGLEEFTLPSDRIQWLMDLIYTLTLCLYFS